MGDIPRARFNREPSDDAVAGRLLDNGKRSQMYRLALIGVSLSVLLGRR